MIEHIEGEHQAGNLFLPEVERGDGFCTKGPVHQFRVDVPLLQSGWPIGGPDQGEQPLQEWRPDEEVRALHLLVETCADMTHRT